MLDDEPLVFFIHFLANDETSETRQRSSRWGPYGSRRSRMLGTGHVSSHLHMGCGVMLSA